MPIQDLEQAIHRVLAETKNKEIFPFPAGLSNSDQPKQSMQGVYSSTNEAIQAAKKAQKQLLLCSLDKRRKIISALRVQARLYAKELAELAIDETKFGDLNSKVKKNLLVADKTPGLEILEPAVMSGDHGLTVFERAPYGVICSITPSTNPTATIINNAISMITAGNSVVFNVHPRAKRVSLRTVELLNKAIRSVNGPVNLLTVIAEPTIESAQALMNHPGVDLILVTGGPAVVKTAMLCGRRAICAGPGNPPAVVDETANIEKTAIDLIKGSSFDNNLPCTCEKEVFVVSRVIDQLKKKMQTCGGYEITGDENKERLFKRIFRNPGSPWNHGEMAPELIGQSAKKILAEIGLQTGDDTKLVFIEVNADHPLVWTEQMMPVLPLIRVENFDEAVDLAFRAELGFHHSAGIHSLDIRNLSLMAKIMDTAIFIKNGPHYCGLGFESEGFTSFSIGTFTREGLTTAKSFTWERRCVLVDYFRIV